MFRLLTASLVALSIAAVSGCGDKEKHEDHDGSGSVADTAVGGKARDPNCGALVDVNDRTAHVYRNTRFYFCTPACLDKFKAAPSKTTTGLPGEGCVCTAGGMKKCGCGHCADKPERCECGDPAEKEGGHEDHDHHGH